MSLDKNHIQNLIGMGWTNFAAPGGLTRYYEYGRGGLQDGNSLRGVHCAVTRGVMYQHKCGSFQNTGFNMTMEIDVNGVNVPAAALIVPPGIFVAVVVVRPINFDLLEGDVIRGRNVFALAIGLYLNSSRLEIDVITR